MKNIRLTISDQDFSKLGLSSDALTFEELMGKIKTDIALDALRKMQQLAFDAGISEMSMEEIDAEIKATRDAKNNS